MLPGRRLLLAALVLLFMLAWLAPKFVRAEPNPTPAPVAAPIAAPIAAPVAAPIAAPVVVPVATPVAGPIEAPVVAPVVAPVAAPTPIKASPYDSKYGSCRGNWCLAPALAIQALQYVPATGDMTGGVAFAGGYGVVWHTMIDLGLAFYAGVQFSRDKPYTAQGTMMFNVANYFAFGPGFLMLGQPSGPAKFQLTICFAANWIPGLIAPD